MPRLIFSFGSEVRFHVLFNVRSDVKFHVFFTEKMEEHFDPTDETDYIYNEDTIIYYIGQKRRPEIPATLEGVQVRRIEITAFNHTNVEAVKIPDSVIRIE